MWHLHNCKAMPDLTLQDRWKIYFTVWSHNWSDPFNHIVCTICKFHLIRIFHEVSVNIFSIISCLKCTVNSNFHLIRRKFLPTNHFELTVADLYLVDSSLLGDICLVLPPGVSHWGHRTGCTCNHNPRGREVGELGASSGYWTGCTCNHTWRRREVSELVAWVEVTRPSAAAAEDFLRKWLKLRKCKTTDLIIIVYRVETSPCTIAPLCLIRTYVLEI